MSLVIVDSIRKEPKATVKQRERYINTESTMYRIEGYTRLVRNDYRTLGGRRIATGLLLNTIRQVIVIGNTQYKHLSDEAFAKAIEEEQDYIRVKCNNGILSSRTTYSKKTIYNHLTKLEALGYITDKENPLSVHKFKKDETALSRTDDFTLFLPKSLVVCDFSNIHDTDLKEVYAQTQRVSTEDYNDICSKLRSGKTVAELKKKASHKAIDSVALEILKGINMVSMIGGVTPKAQKQLVGLVVNVANSVKKSTTDNQQVTSVNQQQLQQVPYLKEKAHYNNHNVCGKLNKVSTEPTIELNSFAEKDSERKQSEVSINSFLNILTQKATNSEKDFAAERERQIKALEKAGFLEDSTKEQPKHQDSAQQQQVVSPIQPSLQESRRGIKIDSSIEKLATRKGKIESIQNPYHPYFQNLNLHKIHEEGRKLPELQFFAQALWRKSNRKLWANKVWVKPYVDTAVEFMKLHLIARKEEVERENKAEIEEWQGKYAILKATDRKLHDKKLLKFRKNLPNPIRLAYRRLNRAIDKAYEHGQKYHYTKFYPPLTGKLPYLKLYAKVGLWNATDWAISEEKSLKEKKQKELNDFLNHQKSLMTVSSYEYAVFLKFRKEGIQSALHYQKQLLHKLTTLDCVQALDKNKQTEIIEAFKNTKILWQI